MTDTATSPPALKHSSWRLAPDVADQLAAAIDDLHYATRQPKHAVLGAFVAVALEHGDEVAARLADGKDQR